ncbi:elongation factor P lysine(34) lysyltransferase, partial [Gammaproteobacteria bacterium]|nr:elongation factor P lysine(34) lysyltransferase [Gammaproteobacteria bacterium]
DDWLDLLFTHAIEPNLGHDLPIFIYDYPESQAALAKIRHEKPYYVASRFELYFKGVELANGFHELQNYDEQLKRFNKNIEYRSKNNMEVIQIDTNFINALKHGLPDCAGVAMGLDRLIMLALDERKIDSVMSFKINNS